MKQSLVISDDLELPLDAVTLTFAVLAVKGAGKTYTVLALVEEMLEAHLPVVVADPVGVCWGLRSSADGKDAGLPIIVMGGQHGDVPLEFTAGKVIADFVVESRQSVVLDLSLFDTEDQVRFMADFAERLYLMNRTPLHLVLDEADEFAPQVPQKGERRVLKAIERLVRRGRARGIGTTLVTQRAAVLNKNVLTQAEVLIVLQTISSLDRETIDAWVRAHGTKEERDAMMSSLATLPIGTAWFWSPRWLNIFKKVQIRKRRTFDSSATPKVGSQPIAPKRLAEVDLSALRAKIAATIERAKADDPEELRRQIDALRKQVQSGAAAEARVERVEVQVPVPTVPKGALQRLRAIELALEEVGNDLRSVKMDFEALAEGNLQAPQDRQPQLPPPSEMPEMPEPDVSSPVIEEGDNNTKLASGAVRMLRVMARLYPRQLSVAQVATLAKLKRTSGTFGDYVRALKNRGLIIVGPDKKLEITQAGFDYLGAGVPRKPQTTKEVLDMWLSSLPDGAQRMLNALVEIYPQSLHRNVLAERTGLTVTSGTFGDYVRMLKHNGLAETNGKTVRASETLFLGQ